MKKNKNSLSDVLRENKQKAQEKERERIEIINRKQTKETILAYFVMSFILALTIAFIAVTNSDNTTAIDKCIASGKTANYCVKNI